MYTKSLDFFTQRVIPLKPYSSHDKGNTKTIYDPKLFSISKGVYLPTLLLPNTDTQIRIKQMRLCSHTSCDIEHVKFIAQSSPTNEGSKSCSRLNGTCENTIAPKHSQSVLREGDYSTPNLSHWSTSLVQRL